MESGLRVDSRESLLKGGERGAAFVAGKAGDSLLLKAIRRTHEDLAMPPGKRLPDDVVADFARWVDMGAHWPEKSALLDSAASRRDAYWSFQPLRRPAISAVQDASCETSA